MSSRAVQHEDAEEDGGVSMVKVSLGDHEATCVRLRDPRVLPAVLAAAGLPMSRPVVVVVGGAGGLRTVDVERLAPVFTAGLVPAIGQCGAVAVDGGTNSGVMRMLGVARGKDMHAFRLVGVVAEGTVNLPESQGARDDAADLEPHHTDFVVVPGVDWGAESPWVALTATAIAAGQPTVTVLVNGGDIAFADVSRSLDVGRPVLVVAGSGRTADKIAGALRGEVSDRRAAAIASSGLIRSVPAGDPSMLRDAVVAALETPTT